MSAAWEEIETSNPFSTRFVRPGALPYLFSAGDACRDAEEMVRRLADLGWRGQIVGPHGSGKSTLLATLAPALAAAGQAPCLFTLCDGQRTMPSRWTAHARKHQAGIIVVDGYEQLGLLARLRLAYRCRREGWGLLVTAHQDVGLPTLARTNASLEVARAIVERLYAKGEAAIEPDEVSRCFSAAGGNLREMLFALYDRHERIRRCD